MTLIIATADGMWCDSGRFSGSIALAGKPESKILRLPDKSLVGCSGTAGRIGEFLEWLALGAKKATANGAQVDGFRAIQLMPSGACWRWDSATERYPVCLPALIGESDAVAFAMGALAATARCGPLCGQTAMELAVESCVWVRGPIEFWPLVE